MSHPPPPGDPGPTQPHPGQPGPVHPNAHLWPAYRPTPRPERPLGRALAWSALFSFAGVILGVLAIAALVFVLYSAFWLFLVVVEVDVWNFWGFVTEVHWIDALVGPVGLFIVVATIVGFAVCTIALVLLRRLDGFRRWPAALQGLTAAGATYAVSTFLVAIIDNVASLIGG